MSQRIAAAFSRVTESGRASALIPYIAAGDPSPAATVPLMHALVKAGADILELGVPFSDPMADGPVIQRAAERAIAQGMGLARVLQAVAEFRRQDDSTPVVLMGYGNPIERMGQQAFVQAARQAGVDGVLVVDYPPEEMDDFSAALDAAGIAPIFLLAPTTTEARMQAIGRVARGYAYYVSLKGVTGSGSLDTDDVARRLALIRRHIGALPVGVGFGIRDADSASRIARHADAVVIGSKLIETMEQAVADVPPAQQTDAAIRAASLWLGGIRAAMDQVKRERAPA
ncbi:tryptophan synthase subunit alpha [Bordetella hinzii]|uniref:Tryptophan synthase alpha chain n=2 Tax=Bordetella hinzii TaxID=103855 RepID=A0AAN1RY85_9BORD|nr:tryptophan synthase subunit alpha [Bordetella hinzii]AKQ56617.1 Tryptophan synthase alpha chain [Bordetella hinzii]AKQ61075.1 Tryptophan synthase alpha chain [Bordetella hinzii]AZW17925.1 tryptophan synthase subunit alpha [Bordetella hinzii]KCB22159.1 tryptophan synthase, alpha subunit [Bordetella hinzii OH87 BAL007II]KCB28640.1 tryptophan synthase, alpha subunit [Bordetella hinzii L60]